MPTHNGKKYPTEVKRRVSVARGLSYCSAVAELNVTGASVPSHCAKTRVNDPSEIEDQIT